MDASAWTMLSNVHAGATMKGGTLAAKKRRFGWGKIDGLIITDDKISEPTNETEPSKPIPMTPTSSTIFAPFHMPDHGAMQF